jgi:hypothetical protein
MKRAGVFGLVVVGMVLFNGCSSNNAGKIEGTAWRSLAIPGDEFEDGKDRPVGAVKIEFTKGGTVYLRGPEGQYQGKYTLGAGNWVTLHLDRELDGEKIHRERIIIKGSRMFMIDSDGDAVPFEADR